MKKILRLFYDTETGAVSVYLIIVMVPIFFLQAVLIDFARIKAAEREAENAVRAGVRSALSAYDQELHKYGLYGLSQEREKTAQTFAEVWKANMDSGSSEGSFRFLDTKPEAGSELVSPMYALSNHTIFERQILEEMKYRAPLEFTISVTDKLQRTGAIRTMGQSSVFAKEAKKLEKLIEAREEALNQAWDIFIGIQNETNRLHALYAGRIAELNRLSGLIGLHTIDEIERQITDLRRQIESVEQSIRDLDMSMAITGASSAGVGAAAALQSMAQARSALAEQLSALSTDMSKLQELLDNIKKYAALLVKTKADVADHDTEMQNKQTQFQNRLSEAKKANDELNTELKRIAGSYSSSELKAFGIFQSVKVISEEELRLYQTGVASTAALFSGFNSQIASIERFSPPETEKANAANDAYKTKADETFDRQHPIETARQRQYESVKQEKERQRASIRNSLQLAKQAIGDCDIAMQAGEMAGLFENGYASLEGGGDAGLFGKYMKLNDKEAVQANGLSFDMSGTPDGEIEKSMGLLEALGGMGLDLRNELYVNEYALTKFNYRTLGKERDPSGRRLENYELSEPAKHKLQDQEAEYLIYGFPGCAQNLSSAYGEMFAFRFAVHMAEALSDPKNELLNIGSPLLMLLVCAAEAAGKALLDMNKLVNGESVPISDKLAPRLGFTYKDYLRIFLLLHSNDAKLMARMQGLIEWNTGVALDKTSTYVQVSAESSVRLWFLPGLMAMMNKSGLSDCQVDGNRCRFVKRADSSY